MRSQNTRPNIQQTKMSFHYITVDGTYSKLLGKIRKIYMIGKFPMPTVHFNVWFTPPHVKCAHPVYQGLLRGKNMSRV
jgi:hypothetical protein